MNKEQAEEKQWLQWFEAQRKAVAFSINGDLIAAIAEVNTHLQNTLIQDIRRRAVGFRGDLWEEYGNLAAAKVDFITAHELSEDPDFERYTLELALGGLNRKLKNREETISWYLKALVTASADPTISGAAALDKFLRVREPGPLSKTELELIAKVIRQTWALLRLEGEPDLDELEGTVKILTKAKHRPIHGNNAG